MNEYIKYEDVQGNEKTLYIIGNEGHSFSTIELLLDKPECAYIYNFHVHKSCTKKGYGKALLKYIETYIEQNTQCKYITVQAKSTNMANFFSNNGYICIEHDDDANLFYKLVTR